MIVCDWAPLFSGGALGVAAVVCWRAFVLNRATRRLMVSMGYIKEV